MTVTITRAPTAPPYSTINPFMLLTPAFSWKSSNVVHDVIGSGVPDYTLGVVGTREATYEFLCLTYADASDLKNFHVAPGVFTLTDTTNTAYNVSYVLAEGGQITATLDPENRKRWVVSIDIKAVA